MEKQITNVDNAFWCYLKRHRDVSMNDIIEFENLNHLMKNQTQQRAWFQIIR